MVSRRSLLVSGTGVVVAGAALGGAVATHRLDDALRAVGVEPRPEPDPGDLRLAARARADAEALVVLATGQKAPAAVTAALTAQRDSLPAAPPAIRSDTSAVAGDIGPACLAVAESRAADVLTAVSTDLALVLASLSAGLDQCGKSAS